MTKLYAIQQPFIPQAALTQSRDCTEKEFNLPRHVSLDTGSALFRHSSLEKRPLVSKHRPRRCLTEADIRYLPGKQNSVRNDFGRAAAETFLITRLSFTLLRYLGVGYRWMTKLAALGLYALFLMPGFVQVGWSYFFDKRIQRSIVYGDEPRNRLDLYLPDNLDTPKPVVAFVTGGAWIIGYKAWGSLLGLQLMERDVIVACIDYRNFPQGTVSDMVADVSEGISFICNNIAKYGGDPSRLYLAGQSAGAHLAACALVEQARKESERDSGGKASEEPASNEAELAWRASDFKAYFGISGGYNLYKLVDHFHSRGLYRTLFLSIMEGEGSLLRFSPEHRVQSPLLQNLSALLPHIYLLHGTADYSIPSDASKSFEQVLKSVGIHVTLRLYEGKTHTDLFIQDPMRGDYDVVLVDILTVLHAGDTEAQAKDSFEKPRRRLVPEFLIQLARRVSPF